MSEIVIKAENISKLYRLGEIGTGTISQDVNRWWARIRGKEDPYAKVGEVNDRARKGSSDYVWALKNVSFEVNQGDILGIIGRNGAGKSTLLKILSKVTAPSTGHIKVKGGIASLLEVGTGFHPDLTGRENIFLNGAILGMTKADIKARFDAIVDFAGVERYIDTPVKRYSSGMYVRLAFAVAAFLEPEILIVDEVLAVGDAEFQKKCLGRMKDVSTHDGRTVLFVSHQMNSIKSLCTQCLYLENGLINSAGHTSEIIEMYLNENRSLSNKRTFDQYLKSIEIKQAGDKIIIEAEYSSNNDLDIPHLGFVIYNSHGIPVFASNPTLEQLEFNAKDTYKNGTIIAEVSQPKLIDGFYHVSVWFGDSKENFIEEQDCLAFEVAGMTTKKQYTQEITGNVIPEVKWRFQENG